MGDREWGADGNNPPPDTCTAFVLGLGGWGGGAWVGTTRRKPSGLPNPPLAQDEMLVHSAPLSATQERGGARERDLNGCARVRANNTSPSNEHHCCTRL
jgi:hypothetical protein